jgi:glycosyl transferase, family 25
MRTLRPPSPVSRQPDIPAGPDDEALRAMLRHVPRMDLPFDGDCIQANGIDLPIVAINLAHRTDKWQTLCQRLSAVGLSKIVRAAAVEGARVPAAQVAALLRSPADATCGGPASHLTLTPPAIGCFLSHLAIWRWMLTTSLPRLLVLEDDAQPAASFGVERLRKMLAAPERGLVLLGCRIMTGLADRPATDGEGGAELARVYYFNGTHAYLIARKSCQALLRRLLPLHAHLDHQISSVLMQHRCAFPAWYAAPPLFDCDWSFGSDLYISAHHLSDESAADAELGQIIARSRRMLLAEGRPLLTERNE